MDALLKFHFPTSTCNHATPHGSLRPKVISSSGLVELARALKYDSARAKGSYKLHKL